MTSAERNAMDLAALRVPCVFCGAEPGKFCESPWPVMFPLFIHYTRHGTGLRKTTV